MNNTKIIKVRSKVQVHPYCTTDPVNKQAHEGYVTNVDRDNDTITVRFADGVVGNYSEDVLINKTKQ